MEHFKQVTGADGETATFYLESSGGDLESAVAAFFEGGPARAGCSPASSAPGPGSASPRAPAAGPCSRHAQQPLPDRVGVRGQPAREC